MRNRYRAAWMILMCCVLGLLPLGAAAETGLNEANSVLQKGLTLYEIDQELARIDAEQQRLQGQQNEIKQNMIDQQSQTEQMRAHAAQVLRAYYIGDRDAIWMLLFSVDSLSDALTTLEYLSMIINNDHRSLQQFADKIKELNRLRVQLEQSQADLDQTKTRYITQKDQIVVLQKQLDEELAKQQEPKQLQQQIKDLTQDWQDKGVPLFRTYFQALAEAMKQLPELATAGNGKNSNLILNGFNQTFQITDQELNLFLRQKNKLFENMSFRFTGQKVVAEGKQDDTAISIKGHYVIDSQKNKNAILFVVDELLFNGFQLPQTTISSLEKDFDLGIYPQKLASFLQVTGMSMEEGKLSIQLKFAL
ncbi:hypothetical protein EYB31_14685 [Paenibacillus thalictri]|uniref:Uncharacterized protein n=2 Tax=Paenibacillus thalictri TaxID=2527873 RepID=A0A4V2J468_9BACL|nr:hypothetical protein EYB31_14685 [Paenibacillus thalictri]